jgi:membrane protein YqaA with SNARE-associated domain
MLETVVEFLQNWGYIGLIIGAFIAGSAIPFSVELLLTAMLVSGVNPIIAYFSTVIPNWLGVMTSYAIGRLCNWERIEKWTRIKREKLEQQREKIVRYGAWLALCTSFPIIGTVITVALGVYEVSFTKTALLTLVEKFVRFGIWMLIFYFASNLLPAAWTTQ